MSKPAHIFRRGLPERVPGRRWPHGGCRGDRLGDRRGTALHRCLDRRRRGHHGRLFRLDGLPADQDAQRPDATAAAIDTLRDGVHFAVSAARTSPRRSTRRGRRLAVADARDPRPGQAGAAQAERGRRHRDRHLAPPRRPAAVLRRCADPARHPAHRRPQRARVRRRTCKAALDACAGRFTCDARGVGTDWEVKEVTRIASALLGTADIVADPAGLPPTSRAMMETAMGKEVADVALRLWTPLGTEIKFVKQVPAQSRT